VAFGGVEKRARTLEIFPPWRATAKAKAALFKQTGKEKDQKQI